MTVFKWSQTAALNSTADSTINWAEGQAPSSVNNSARAMMAAIAKLRDDMSGNLETGGSSTAYTLATNQNLTPLADGYSVVARINATNGASPTLNVDSTGAKAIRTSNGVAVATAAMLIDSIQRFTYDSDDDCWYVHGFFSNLNLVAPSGTKMVFWQTAAPTGWTKDTDHNDKALRITSGTASTGGTVAFETAFASKSVAGTIGGTAITIAQMPLHGHPVRYGGGGSAVTDGGGIAMNSNNDDDDSPAHTGSPTSERGEQVGGTGGGETHTHTFTGTPINLDVAFVDVILAVKD